MALQVTVTTAVKLTADQRKEVQKVAEAKTGHKNFELVETIDPSIIGGVRLTLGSQQYDASVKNTLDALRNLA